MSSGPFDELDQALASGLSSLAPDVDGGDAALATLLPRFQRARTRRRVARAGAMVAALLVVGSVAALAAPDASHSHVTVSSPPTTRGHTRPRVKHHATTSTTVPVTRKSTPTSVTVATTPGSKSPGHPTQTTPVTNTVTVPSTPPGSGPTGGGDGHDGSTTTTFTGTGEVHVWQSPGGTVKWSFFHGALKLLGVHAAPGYTAEVRDNGPDHLDVRFTQDGHQSFEFSQSASGGHHMHAWRHTDSDGDISQHN